MDGSESSKRSLMTWALNLGWCGAVLSALCVVAFAELAWVHQQQQAIKTAQRQVQRLRKELRDYDKLTPSLNSENAFAAETELASLKQMIAQTRDRLSRDSLWEEQREIRDRDSQGADAYFEIAAFVERTRDRARSHGVRISPQEYFGFGAYRHSGPTPDERAAVLVERAVAERVLQVLLESQPKELTAVTRDSTSSLSERSPPGRSVSGADRSTTDPRLSLRGKHGLDVNAFKLSFTGQTVTLRLFLNRLMQDPLPVAVRCVEIEPMPKTLNPGPANSDETERVAPLVERALSKFTVTIEAFQFSTPEASNG